MEPQGTGREGACESGGKVELEAQSSPAEGLGDSECRDVL